MPGTFESQDAAPYLIIDFMCATIPNLLAMADQFQKASWPEGDALFFPKQVIMLTWVQLRKAQPLEITGLVGGAEAKTPTGQILAYFNCEDGFTPEDRSIFFNAMKHNQNLRGLYEYVMGGITAC